jgi:carnitine O-acetyltransferase
MIFRCPVMIHVSPFLLLTDDPLRKTQVTRSAYLVYHALKCNERIKNNLLEPDMEKNEPFDMGQYRRLFATARIPGFGRDKYLTWTDSKHIVVIVKDLIFALNVYDVSICLNILSPQKYILFVIVFW